MNPVAYIQDLVRREFALAVPVIGVAVAAFAAKYNIVINTVSLDEVIGAIGLGLITRIGVSPAKKLGV